MDLRLEGDTGASGDWRIGERLRYVKTGDYSGSVTGEYSEDEDGSSWKARIIHSQAIDAKTTFSANMQFIGGERETDLNSIDSESIVTEQSNASASLSRIFHDNNSIAELSYNRSKDLRNSNSSRRATTSYSQNRIYPFLQEDDWRSHVLLQPGFLISVSLFRPMTLKQPVIPLIPMWMLGITSGIPTTSLRSSARG